MKHVKIIESVPNQQIYDWEHEGDFIAPVVSLDQIREQKANIDRQRITSALTVIRAVELEQLDNEVN